MPEREPIQGAMPEEAPQAMFRARVLGGNVEKATVVSVGDGTQSGAFGQGEAPYVQRGFVGIGGALPPLQDARFLCEVYENSCALPQNVEAYRNNIDGFGFRLEPLFNFDNSEVDKQIEMSMRLQRNSAGKWALGPKPSDKDLKAEKIRIQEQMELEKMRVDAFFSNCSLDMSFIELRRQMRVDLEVTGNAYWECLRNGFRELVQFNHLPSITMKLLPADPEPTAVDVEITVTPITRETARVEKRFRRFVQEVEGRVVFFKELGDPRVISRKSGRVYVSEEAIRTADAKDGPATEIMHFKLYSPRSPYGLPRWHGNLLAAVGTRAAEEINYFYFDNKSVPPMAILVSGGRLSDGSADRITKFIQDEIRGRGNFHKVLVIEAEPANIGIQEGAAGLRSRVAIQPLTGAQHKDALFQDYIEDNVDRIGMSFRLPRPLRGDVTAVNRATFEGSLRFAEMQVFEPERRAFDDQINQRVFPDLGIYLWRFRSNAPDTRDPMELSNIIANLVEKGVLTPAEGRELAADVFSRSFPKITEPWVNYPLRLSQVGLTPVVGPGVTPAGAISAPGSSQAPGKTNAKPQGVQPRAATPNAAGTPAPGGTQRATALSNETPKQKTQKSMEFHHVSTGPLRRSGA